MAKGKAIGNAFDFVKGMNAGLRPKATVASLKAMDKTSREAAQQVLKSNPSKAGIKMAKGAMNNKMTGGIANTIYNMDNGAGKVNFKDAIKAAHSVVDNNAPNGTRISKSKVAGTVATAGIAGRVATGGGLYRDRYGNVNLPGVPFI